MSAAEKPAMPSPAKYKNRRKNKNTKTKKNKEKQRKQRKQRKTKLSSLIKFFFDFKHMMFKNWLGTFQNKSLFHASQLLKLIMDYAPKIASFPPLFSDSFDYFLPFASLTENGDGVEDLNKTLAHIFARFLKRNLCFYLDGFESKGLENSFALFEQFVEKLRHSNPSVSLQKIYSGKHYAGGNLISFIYSLIYDSPFTGSDASTIYLDNFTIQACVIKMIDLIEMYSIKVCNLQHYRKSSKSSKSNKSSHNIADDLQQLLEIIANNGGTCNNGKRCGATDSITALIAMCS